LGALLGLAYFIGIFVAFLPYHWRAGLDKNWREFLFLNIPWFLMTLGKQLIWPIVLVYWVARGCPKCPWVAISNYQGQETRKILRRETAVANGLVT
jgi:hypothetical protein